MSDREGRPRAVPDTDDDPQGALMTKVARGDEGAFDQLYDLVSPQVFGLVRKLVRSPAQAEEVTQEVLIELWRTACHYDPARGAVTTWVLTLAHRRAVDRVRSEQASTTRERNATAGSNSVAYDQVEDQVLAKLDHEQVKRCLGALTTLQREAVTLAYYAGYTYREVADLLGANLATIKTRMRDGLIRMRDCLGVGFEGPR